MFGLRNADDGRAEAGALLLRDIRLVFLHKSAARLPSAEIVNELVKMEERPWPEWRNGWPMTAPQLARALAPFGIRPGTIRTGTGTAKGYYHDAFNEAWRRYLPDEASPAPQAPGAEPSHRHKPGNSRHCGESGPSHRAGV